LGSTLERISGLKYAACRLRLTARGYHRVLKVARTLAHLKGVAEVKRIHIAEALFYRRIVPARGGEGACVKCGTVPNRCGTLRPERETMTSVSILG
jgi:hypothetical protein